MHVGVKAEAPRPHGGQDGTARVGEFFAAEESFVGNGRGIGSRLEIRDAHGVGYLDHRVHWKDIAFRKYSMGAPSVLKQGLNQQALLRWN